MTKFSKSLEQRVNDIAACPEKDKWDDTIEAMLRRQIALTSEQLKRLKQRHDEQFGKLLRLECRIETDLLQFRHLPRELPFNLPQEDKLKQRLFDIEKERRSLSLKLEEKTQSLETKLLELLNQHRQLDI